jgi:hypothetical protein
MDVDVGALLTNYKVATGRRCVSSSWRETTYLHGCKQGEDLNPVLEVATYLHGYKHGGSSYPLPAGGPSPPWLHVRRRSASPSTVTSTATCKKETCTPLTEVLHHPNV